MLFRHSVTIFSKPVFNLFFGDWSELPAAALPQCDCSPAWEPLSISDCLAEI